MNSLLLSETIGTLTFLSLSGSLPPERRVPHPETTALLRNFSLRLGKLIYFTLLQNKTKITLYILFNHIA